MIKIFFITLFISQSSHARIFSFGKETLAGYFSVAESSSAVAKNLSDKESSASSYSKGLGMNLSGEFGISYIRHFLGLRFGLEFMKPLPLDNVTASDAAGNTLYTGKYDLLAYAPKVGLEFYLINRQTTRVYLLATIGSSSVTITNSYASPTIAPGASFSEQTKGSATTWTAGAGWEYYLFDTTTICFEVYQRSLNYTSLTYASAGTNFIGTHAAGDPVLKTDGTARQVNLGGTYIGLTFKFFVH